MVRKEISPPVFEVYVMKEMGADRRGRVQIREDCCATLDEWLGKGHWERAT